MFAQISFQILWESCNSVEKFGSDIMATISLRIICHNAPRGAFGLQNKNRDIINGVALDDGRLAFDFELTVKQKDNGQPNFTGQYAHGTVKERFVYLTTKVQVGVDTWEIVRRSKVHLKTITWEQVEAVLANPSAYFEAEVDVSRSMNENAYGKEYLEFSKKPYISRWVIVSYIEVHYVILK